MATTRHAVRVSHMDSKAGNEPDWMEEYKAVLSPTPTAAKKAEGPGCCPICCTGFSIFGALFLFVIAAAMKSDYPYMHIDGDLNDLSKSVTYAGLVYLGFALVAGFFWVRGLAARPAAAYASVE